MNQARRSRPPQTTTNPITTPTTNVAKMNHVPQGKQHVRKQNIEHEERNQRRIEQPLPAENPREFRVDHQEKHGARHDTVEFEERDGFGAAVRYDERVLGIADGGEDVDEEEHHGGHGEELG